MKVKLVTFVLGCTLIFVGGHAFATGSPLPFSSKLGSSAMAVKSVMSPTAHADNSRPLTHTAGTNGVTRSTGAKSNGSSTLSLADFTERAFATTGAQVDGYVVHDWTQINSTFESSREIAKIVETLGQELGIQKAKKISQGQTGDGHVGETFYEQYGTWADSTKISVTVSSFRFNTGAEETILVISATSTGHNLSDYNGDVVAVQKAVASIGASSQISACIEGSRGAMMGDGQAQSLIQNAFKSVGASSVEGVKTSELTSVSGYSTESPQYILTRGRKMNIQIGIHNDTVQHRTNIVVGTPIITVTY